MSYEKSACMSLLACRFVIDSLVPRLMTLVRKEIVNALLNVIGFYRMLLFPLKENFDMQVGWDCEGYDQPSEIVRHHQSQSGKLFSLVKTSRKIIVLRLSNCRLLSLRVQGFAIRNYVVFPQK